MEQGTPYVGLDVHKRDIVVAMLAPGARGAVTWKLAELLRADLLTEVHAPSEQEEAVRDLCRCREDVKQDLTRCRHRLGKFLLRQGLRYGAGRAWEDRNLLLGCRC